MDINTNNDEAAYAVELNHNDDDFSCSLQELDTYGDRYVSYTQEFGVSVSDETDYSGNDFGGDW